MVAGNLSIEALVKGYELLDVIYAEIDVQAGMVEHSCESCCMHNTPMVTLLEAKYILANNTVHLSEMKDKSLEWLTHKHVGITMYERIQGRGYSRAESQQVYAEMEVAKAISCPFVQADGGCYFLSRPPLACAVHQMPDNERISKAYRLLKLYLNKVAPSLKTVSFLPTLLVTETSPDVVRALVDQGEIADGKLAVVKRIPGIYGDEEEELP